MLASVHTLVLVYHILLSFYFSFEKIGENPYLNFSY